MDGPNHPKVACPFFGKGTSPANVIVELLSTKAGHWLLVLKNGKFYAKLKNGMVLVYWGLTPQQQPGSYQGGEMMMMKSVFWWRKPQYPEETTDLRQITEKKMHGIFYSC